MGDIIIIVLLSFVVACIVRVLWKQHKQPNACNGDCGSCHQSCRIDWDQVRKDMKSNGSS